MKKFQYNINSSFNASFKSNDFVEINCRHHCHRNHNQHKLIIQNSKENNKKVKIEEKNDEEKNCDSLCGMNSICCSSACSSQSCSSASSLSISSSSSASLGEQSPAIRFAKFLPRCSESLQSSRTTENSNTSISSSGSINEKAQLNELTRNKKFITFIKSKNICSNESDASDVEERSRWAVCRSYASKIRSMNKNLLQLPQSNYQQSSSKTVPSSPNIMNADYKKFKNINSFNHSTPNSLFESSINNLSKNYGSSSTPSNRRFFFKSLKKKNIKILLFYYFF